MNNPTIFYYQENLNVSMYPWLYSNGPTMTVFGITKKRKPTKKPTKKITKKPTKKITKKPTKKITKKVSFGYKSIAPTNKLNYQIYQYSNNASTPTLNQLNNISSTNTAYSYPIQRGMSNMRSFVPTNNTSGYGF
jgi:hypothetical protein